MTLWKFRRIVLGWFGGVDQWDYSRIVAKYFKEQQDRLDSDRQHDFNYARLSTALDEKDRAYQDCKRSLADAALQLSIRNVGPIETMDRVTDLLEAAICNDILPAYAEGKIRQALQILHGNEETPEARQANGTN